MRERAPSSSSTSSASNRGAWPSTKAANYELGPLVEDKRLAVLATRLEGKVVKSASARKKVQAAVWELYEDGVLGRETDASLDALPDRSPHDASA